MENILGTGYQPPRCHLWQKYKLNFWRNEDHRREKVDESQFCNFLFFLSFSFFFFFFFFFWTSSVLNLEPYLLNPTTRENLKYFSPPPIFLIVGANKFWKKMKNFCFLFFNSLDIDCVSKRCKFSREKFQKFLHRGDE